MCVCLCVCVCRDNSSGFKSFYFTHKNCMDAFYSETEVCLLLTYHFMVFLFLFSFFHLM